MNKKFVTRDTTMYPIPSGYMFFDGFKKLGWDTFYIPLPNQGGHKLIEYDYGGEVDILFDYVNILSNPNHIDELREFKSQNPNCKIFVSVFLPYEHNKTQELDERFNQYHGLVDYFFNSTIQHNRAKEDFRKLGFTYLNIPFPSMVDPTNSNIPYVYDIAFIGTTDSGERLVDIWYPEFSNPKYKSYASGFKGNPNIGFKDMLNISTQTKINLNPHYLDQIAEDPNNIHSRIDFNTRVFHLASLGCFQLTNHPYFKKVFGENYPVFDKSNFKELLNYYMDNENERNGVIKQAQEIVLKNHTSLIYAQKISTNNFKFI